MNIQLPVQAVVGNLIFTTRGAVWGVWRMQARPYGMRSIADKDLVRALHTALFRALPGESLLLGLCASLDPRAVVERMIDKVDLDKHEGWAAECEATLDTLEQIELGERAHWLAVPLGNLGRFDTVRDVARAALSWIQDRGGIPRRVAGINTITRRLAEASEVMNGLPKPFRPLPASEAQIAWIFRHAQVRGLSLEGNIPAGASTLLTPSMPGALPAASNPAELEIKSAGCIPAMVLDEGGVTDVEDHPGRIRRTVRRIDPLHLMGRRFVKVIAEGPGGGLVQSYQGHIVLSDTPRGEMTFPGSEILGRIDDSGVNVDWALRLQVLSSQEALRLNRKALLSLAEQFNQREGELSHGVATLDRAAEQLAEYVSLLEADKAEVECQATIVFCVAAPTAALANEHSRNLVSYLEGAEYGVQRPLGFQTELWWGMLPGVARNQLPTVRHFAHIMPSSRLSPTIPLASSDLGDRRGSLLGINITGGRPSPVLHDIAGASDRDISGSVVLNGEPGGGKTATVKKLGGDALDRGGQLIVPDPTESQEWLRWAKELAEVTAVDVLNPEYSMDPLRMFPRVEGARITKGYLSTLLHTGPNSDLGMAIGDVLDVDYLARHQLDSSAKVFAHLDSAECTIECAHELYRRMRTFARHGGGLGRVIFDDSLPTVDLDTPGLVIGTYGLTVPNRDELNTRHLFDSLDETKVFGRAIYALIAGTARYICFRDETRLGLLAITEASKMLSSPEGLNQVKEQVRDGRKNRAAVVIDSQNAPADLADDETLLGLIKTRLQFRQTDVNLARVGLEWVGFDPDEPEFAEHVKRLREDTSPEDPDTLMVPEERRGEAFMQDYKGNRGRIKVLLPAREDRRAAVLTTPGSRDDSEDAA